MKTQVPKIDVFFIFFFCFILFCFFLHLVSLQNVTGYNQIRQPTIKCFGQLISH